MPAHKLWQSGKASKLPISYKVEEFASVSEKIKLKLSIVVEYKERTETNYEKS